MGKGKDACELIFLGKRQDACESGKRKDACESLHEHIRRVKLANLNHATALTKLPLKHVASSCKCVFLYCLDVTDYANMFFRKTQINCLQTFCTLHAADGHEEGAQLRTTRILCTSEVLRPFYGNPSSPRALKMMPSSKAKGLTLLDLRNPCVVVENMLKILMFHLTCMTVLLPVNPRTLWQKQSKGGTLRES